MYSFPVTISGGQYKIVQGLAIDDFSREKMDITKAELEGERDAVKDLI
jgi:malate dehydrogenase